MRARRAGILAAGAAVLLVGCGAAAKPATYDVSVGFQTVGDLPDMNDVAAQIPSVLHNINPAGDPGALRQQLVGYLTNQNQGPQGVEAAVCSEQTTLLYRCDVGDGTVLSVQLTLVPTS